MRIFNYLTLLLFLVLGSQLASNAQTVYTEIYPNIKVPIEKETLNVRQYASKYKGPILDYTYTETDGTRIQLKSYKRNSEIEVFEYPPAPAIHIVYKVFHPNGNLKYKGVFLPNQLEVGKWIECDARGECTITDLEINRKVFGYNDILEFLEQEKIYYNTDGNQWKCTFWHTPQNNEWGVRIDKNGQEYKMFTFDDKGEKDVVETDLISVSKPVPVVGTFEQEEK